MPSGKYKHKPMSGERREKARKAYYKWSGRKDPMENTVPGHPGKIVNH